MKKIVVRILLVTVLAVTSAATPAQFDGGAKPPICIPGPCIALPVH